MTTFLSTLRNLRPVLLVASAALLLKSLFILLSSIEGLMLTTWLIDDAFIEIAVARNIALGHGFSYDFIHPTTGSPFLWTYLISLNFLLFGKVLAIKMCLILSSFFAALASVVVYSITKHLTKNNTAAWIAFILAVFSGNAFFEAMNGMDTAIFTLFTVLAFAFYCGVWTEHLSPLKRGLLTGAVTGLALLTRGDGLFVAGTIGLLHLIDIGRNNNRKAAMQSLMGFVALAAIGWIIITLWQMSVTGSPFLANQIGRREIALGWHHFSFENFQLLPYLKIVVWNTFQLEKLISIATGSSVLCFVALLYAYTKKETRQFAAVTLVYILSFGGALVAYQWYFPDFHGLRYINPLAHLTSVLLGIFLSGVFAGPRTIRLAWVSVASLIILSLYSFYALAISMPWAKFMSLTARPTAVQIETAWGPINWIKNNLPAGSILGVRDHGRMALFTELPIQDIAGNIDPNVPAILKKPNAAEELLAYFRKRNLTHLLLLNKGLRNDRIYQVLYESFPLEEIPGVSSPGTTLYRIAWEKLK